MKKIIISLLFITSPFLLSSQNNNENLYLYINNKNFWPDFLGYKAVIGLSSKDERFSHDNYLFRIDYRSLDYQTLYSLGIPINIDSIKYIKNPRDYYKNYSNCDLHEKFNLHKSIIIITEIPKNKLEQEKDKSKTHVMFPAQYIGTQKNLTWMNNTGKDLIDH